MGTALSDLRQALRVLSRRKAFALAVLSVLTLAIGANIAIFTLVSDTLLRPCPFPIPFASSGSRNGTPASGSI